MPEPQRMAEQRHAGDVEKWSGEADYFGVPISDLTNARTFGLEAAGGQDLYRVSYLYLLVWAKGGDDSDEYGGIQLRAETYLWLDQGAVPTQLQRWIQNSAHRAAWIYNTSVEEWFYGNAGGDWGPGYLDGFTPVENGAEYPNWEVEPIANQERGTPGMIDWTVEIYNEVNGTEYAELAGKASGLANPWDHFTSTEDGQPPIHVPPTKWRIRFQDSRGDYEIRPEPGTDASSRYREGAGAGKTVYVNGKKIGGLGPKGRVWLKPEYAVGDGRTYRGNYSRTGLVDETPATWQAIRKGGVLYQTGETEEGVYLATRRARPDDWRGADPDSVPTDLEVQEGREARTEHYVRLPDTDEPLDVEAHRDEEVIDKMGQSTPPYRHPISDRWKWPHFRPVEEYGVIMQPGPDDDDLDEGQAGLDSFGGGV